MIYLLLIFFFFFLSNLKYYFFLTDITSDLATFNISASSWSVYGFFYLLFVSLLIFYPFFASSLKKLIYFNNMFQYIIHQNKTRQNSLALLLRISIITSLIYL
ncbi:hypothetical protein QKA_2951 [Clostridioides difficile DA00165]|nr:hypothetical protein QKA_2951 [Clostridioides difficile DA00165]